MKRLLSIFCILVINNLLLIGNDQSIDAQKDIIKQCVQRDTRDYTSTIKHTDINACTLKNTLSDFEQKKAQPVVNSNQSLSWKRTYFKGIAVGGALSFLYWISPTVDVIQRQGILAAIQTTHLLRIGMDVGTIAAAWIALNDICKDEKTDVKDVHTTSS